MEDLEEFKGWRSRCGRNQKSQRTRCMTCADGVITACTWSLHGDRPFPLSSSKGVKYGSTVFWCCDSELREGGRHSCTHVKCAVHLQCSTHSLPFPPAHNTVDTALQPGQSRHTSSQGHVCTLQGYCSLSASSTECMPTPLAKCVHRLTHTHTHACMHTHTETHTHTCTHAHMHRLTHTHMHAHTVNTETFQVSQHNCSCACCLPCAAAH